MKRTVSYKKQGQTALEYMLLLMMVVVIVFLSLKWGLFNSIRRSSGNFFDKATEEIVGERIPKRFDYSGPSDSPDPTVMPASGD